MRSNTASSPRQREPCRWPTLLESLRLLVVPVRRLARASPLGDLWNAGVEGQGAVCGDPVGGQPQLVFEVYGKAGFSAAVGAAESDGGTGFEGELVVSVENWDGNGGGQGGSRRACSGSARSFVRGYGVHRRGFKARSRASGCAVSGRTLPEERIGAAGGRRKRHGRRPCSR